MSFERIKGLASTTAFRLTAWYSTIFIISSILIFLLALRMLSYMVAEQDRKQINLKLQEYLSTARDEGVDDLLEEIIREKEYYQAAGYFVRLVDGGNHTLFCFIPRRFKDINCSDIPTPPATKKDGNLILRRHDDEDVLEILSADLPGHFIIQVGKSSTEREDLIEKFYRIFFIILLLVTATGLASGAFLAFKALAPLRDLIHTVRKITAGSMDARVPVRQGKGNVSDELDTLAKLFNEMLHRINRLVLGMRESLDYVAHDLRTPVTRLKAVVESTLQKKHTEKELENALMDCAEEAERINVILSTLMDISEAESGVMRLDLKLQPLRPIIMGAVELYEYVAEEKNFSMAVNIPEDLKLPLDKNRFRQAVANLIDNAVKYTKKGGRLQITALSEGDKVILSFSDNGAGIPNDDLPRIFDRLYRGDKSRSQKGLGLGLCIVKAVIEGHRGGIEVESREGRGTTVKVKLPPAQPGA